MVLDKKCKNCGNKVIFNPKIQKMYCEYCQTTRDIIEETETEIEKQSKNLDLYICPNCGAQIVCDETTTSTFCVYCKNTAILKNRLKGIFKPQYIIPFHATKEEAIDAFIELRNGKKLIPDEFLKESNIKEIRGIYIPFWFFDYEVDGSMNAKTTKSKTNSGNNCTILTTCHYDVYRNGLISYDNIPIDASTHFHDNIMRSIEPYDYNNLKKYTSDYLSGFLSELYNVEENAADLIGRKRAKTTAYSLFYKSIEHKNYDDIEVKYSNFNIKKTTAHYGLLPVYMLNIKYQDKFYTFAMNGQTKKMIGNIPLDKKKVVKYFFKTLLTILIIALIITYIIWKVSL